MLGSTTKRILVNSSKRSIRYNSSNNSKNGSDAVKLNLSDLFKRIDQVSAKAAELKNKTANSRLFEAGNKRPGWQKKENNNFANRTVRNDFNEGGQQQMPRQHQQQQQQQQQREGNSETNFRAPRSNTRPSRFPKTVEGERAPAARFNNRGNRPSGFNDRSFKRSTPRRNTIEGKPEVRKPTVAKPIKSKELTAVPLQPKVIAEDFFYGKVPSINATVASRLASIAKLSLNDSKYPYMLPKDVIAQAFPGSKNRFILQRTWKIDPKEDVLKERVQTIVLGQTKDLEYKGKKTELASRTLHDININPNLDLEQKDTMFNIVNGLTDIKTIFKDAHWKKQASK
ncbi:conserved hypothetical protein [Candida dubliniensis CD36]|uniref:Uncharacterized protein n=1 Tax=Candida dubliniensis (strain CD36 / ATCC MYA-646 / CBS 7987 / NCPF 3949 / NRRL Y-17841) TaxID=573826 RepID=B9W7N4_CANDC|nr:conserved hypothetical protein [Candida dubliniensis CD36]CAX44695.1 conserved hypothetical protein [Candida dubliniensis CD36]